LLLSKRLAVTIHDVCHVAIPGMLGRIGRTYAQFMLERVRRSARVILFDSDFSRGEMRRLVGDPAGMARVAHLAVDDPWFTAKARMTVRPMPEPYLVYVGNMKRHKNVPMLLRAFRDVQERIPHRLVLIGRREGLRADPAVDVEARALGERVLVAGEISSDRLQQYVAHADASITASLYEGFGLPALEAMACGCPCVVSRAGSLPEVCADAALYVDPSDRASIAESMHRITTDSTLRAALIEKGRARAQQFSWDRCATQTSDLLVQALR
jgi:glycosyltransferase involved in cell wall biosynthesis